MKDLIENPSFLWTVRRMEQAAIRNERDAIVTKLQQMRAAYRDGSPAQLVIDHIIGYINAREAPIEEGEAT